MNRYLILLVTVLSMTLAAVAIADPMDTALASAGKPAGGTKVNPAMPDDIPSVVLSDPPTKQKYLAAMQRFYEYRANGYAYRNRVFEWQLLSSRVIFIVVLVLVAAGIYFAAAQFHVAMLMARRNVQKVSTLDSSPANNPLATQLEISAKGVVVNSSVLGVIILSLSLAFFYLYLVYVYPI